MSWISSTRRSLPKISLDDGGIVPDHVRRALGNDPPIIEHHYPIRDAHHHRHVVLDKQDGYAAVADVSDQLHEGVRFRGVHAGDRLVEQQHRRLGGQRQRHADQPLFTIGQRARKIVGAAFETNPFDQFAGAFPQTALRRPGARQPQYGFEKTEPALAMQPDQQIVVNAVVRKYAGALECADQTEISDLMRLQSIERRSTIAHGAMGWIQKAGNDVERRRLAGAVRPDQADDLALANRKVHVRERNETAEMDGHLFHPQCRRGSCHHACSLASRSEKATGASVSIRFRRFANRCASDGTMPRGNTNRMTISTPPYAIHCASGAMIGRRNTGNSPKIMPPTTGPASEPLPPVMTMITIVTVLIKANTSGSMIRM